MLLSNCTGISCLLLFKNIFKVVCDYCQENTHWINACPLLSSFCFR